MPKVKDEGDGMYSFYCPGCRHDHVYFVNSPHWEKSKGWTFNGDFNNPTFSPSLLNRKGKGLSERCHLYVQNGVINYANDSTHDYSGKKNVEMKDISE